MEKWKRDALYSIAILATCAILFIFANQMDDGHIPYVLGSPNGYLKIWLIVLAILALLLLWRSFRNREGEKVAKIWNSLATLTVILAVIYVMVVSTFGFFLTTIVIFSVITILYSTEVTGKKRGKEWVMQNGKLILFVVLLTWGTQKLFTSVLDVRLPTFSLF